MPGEPRTKEQRRIAAEQRRLARIEEQKQWQAIGQIAQEVFNTKSAPPKWILENANGSLRQTSEGTYKFSLYLWKKIVLKEGYYWETLPDGSEIMACIDPDTGQKQYVIIYDQPKEDMVQIFQAEVNTTTQEVTITQEAILANLDPNDFELITSKKQIAIDD